MSGAGKRGRRMALPIREQAKYWGIALAVFFVLLWALGGVMLPFLIGGAVAYFLDPVADRLERAGLSQQEMTFYLEAMAWALLHKSREGFIL